MLHTVDGFCKPESVAVVGVGGGQAFVCVRGTCQSASVRPCEGGPVVPGFRISYGVIADGISVVGRQQVQPLAVPIGIGIRCRAVGFGAEVAVGVVGVGPGSIAYGLRQELTLVVVGIGRVCAAADGGNIAQGVVSVVILADGPAAGVLVGQAAHQQGGAVGAGTCQIAELAVDEGGAAHRQHTGAEPLQAVVGIGKASAGGGHGAQASIACFVGIAIGPGTAQRAVPGGTELVVIARQPVGRVIGGIVGLDTG